MYLNLELLSKKHSKKYLMIENLSKTINLFLKIFFWDISGLSSENFQWFKLKEKHSFLYNLNCINRLFTDGLLDF